MSIPTKIDEWFRKTGFKALLVWLPVFSAIVLVASFLRGEEHPFLYLPMGIATGLVVWAFHFLYETDRQDQAELFRGSFSYLPTVVGIISAPLWIWVSFAILPDVEGPLFEVTAQIIPVLLLALIIDVRQSRRLETSDLSITILMLLLGEAVALYYAAGAKDPRIAFSVVSYTLVVGFSAIVFAVVADYEESDSKETAASSPSPDLRVVAAALENLVEIARRAEPKQVEGTAAIFVLKNDSNGRYYFNLVATNGRVIATSESYETKAGAINGIESVKGNASNAEINDLTEQ
jgi:uncharacterized protein